MKLASAIAACLLAAGVTIFGLVYRTGVASGADSYGYISEADLWRAGNLHIPQEFAKQLPWPNAEKTVAPMGYREATPDKLSGIVPIYSPGLAMMMAVVESIAGYAAAFWIVPFFGGLLVISIYGVGNRMGGPIVGLSSAVLAALSPIVLYMVLWPMTDVVVAAAWAAVTWAILGRSRGRAAAGGLLTGAAILIRPNLIAVGALIGLWVVARDIRREMQSGPWTWRRIDRAAIFAACVAPGIATVMLFNRALYGSPFKSGYGTLNSVLHLSNFPGNVGRYSEWLFTSETPLMAIALLTLALPIARIWRDRDRAFDALLFTLVAIGTLSCYLFFMPLDEWWYVRFLMPMWPGLFVGLSWLLFARIGAIRTTLGSIVILAIAAHGYWFASQHRITAALEGEGRFVTAAELVRDHTEPNSVIFSLVHAGSLRYYGERMTLRYDELPPQWLDPGVAWLGQHGAHAYLFVEDWELELWKKRFTESPLGQMDMRVVFEMQWPTRMWLFDLTSPRTATWPYLNGFYLPRPSRTPPPGPKPKFTLSPEPVSATQR